MRLAPAGLALQPSRMCHATCVCGHVTPHAVFVYVEGRIPVAFLHSANCGSYLSGNPRLVVCLWQVHEAHWLRIVKTGFHLGPLLLLYIWCAGKWCLMRIRVESVDYSGTNSHTHTFSCVSHHLSLPTHPGILTGANPQVHCAGMWQIKFRNQINGQITVYTPILVWLYYSTPHILT